MESRIRFAQAGLALIGGLMMILAIAGLEHVARLWFGPSITFAYLFALPIWLGVHKGGRPTGLILVTVASLVLCSPGFDLASLGKLALHIAFLSGMLWVFERASMNLRKANRTARQDPLTGLPNRRAISTAAAELFAKATEAGIPISVLAIDCDHFKSINDNFGHAAGDQALRQVADALRACQRPNDIICRTGGDEFTAVLWDGDTMAAHQFIGRVRANLELRGTSPVGTVTISAGIATFGRDGERLDELVARADDRMYRNKNLARTYDRAVVSAPQSKAAKSS